MNYCKLLWTIYNNITFKKQIVIRLQKHACQIKEPNNVKVKQHIFIVSLIRERLSQIESEQSF